MRTNNHTALEFLNGSDLIDPMMNDVVAIPIDAAQEDYSGYEATTLNRRAANTSLTSAINGQQQPSGLLILHDRNNGEYHVNISLNQVFECGDHGDYAALVLWIRTLSPADTVVFHLFSACQKVRRFTILDYASLLNAIFVSPAKTVCHVDYVFQGISAYIALACKELCLTPFARLAFFNLVPPEAQIPTIKTFEGFIQDLFDSAVERKILTVEETEQIKDNRPVILPYTEIQSRGLTA